MQVTKKDTLTVIPAKGAGVTETEPADTHDIVDDLLVTKIQLGNTVEVAEVIE